MLQWVYNNRVSEHVHVVQYVIFVGPLHCGVEGFTIEFGPPGPVIHHVQYIVSLCSIALNNMIYYLQKIKYQYWCSCSGLQGFRNGQMAAARREFYE